MILKQFTFLFLLLFSLLTHSQHYKRTQLDSLKNVQEKQKGIERISGLLTLAEAYIYFQLDTAQLFIDSAREESERRNYEWGICQSYFIESNVKFLQGKTHIEEVKFIKFKCANWFENNGFRKDALMVSMSRNSQVLLSEGYSTSFKNAELFLKQAQNSKDPILLAKAWEQINKSKSSFFNTSNYLKGIDSTLFYLNKTKDSLNIINTLNSNLFNESSGFIPKPELIKLEKIANRWQNPAIQAFFLNIKTYPFALSGNLDSVAYYVNKIDKISLKAGKELMLTNTNTLLQTAYALANDHEQLIKHTLEMAAYHKKYGIQKYLSSDFYELGQSYFILKEYDLAITYFLKSLNINEKLDNLYNVNSIKRRLADLYVITDEYEKAERLYAEVIHWAIQKQEFLVIQIMLGNAYNALAELHQKEKKYDQALLNYQHSFDSFKNSRYRLIEPKACLLSMYIDMGEIEKADSLHNEISTGMLSKYTSKSEKFQFEQGRLFQALGKNIEAVKSFESFLNFNTSKAITEENKKGNYLLYKAYKSIGQDKNALSAFETFKTIEDSLESGKIKENVQKIQSDYEISLKETQIQNLEQLQEISDLKLIQQENQLALGRLYITLLIFAFLILGGIGYLLFRRLKKRKNEEKGEIKKKLEIENLKSQQKAELAEVKNNLYANISHEFKTPLTLIRVPLQDFIAKTSDEDQMAYNSILRNTDYLLEMLDELLGVSNIASDQVELRPTNFNLTRLLSQIKMNFIPLFIGKNIKLNWIIELDQDHFYGDENRLNIVINNLLKNAYSNTIENGWVQFEVRLEEELIITISNKGKQINSTDLPHIFERFYRSNESKYSGNGIGLAWSKQIVELHHGIINVDNSKKEQVTFVVSIPIVKNPLETTITRNQQNKEELKEINHSQQNLPHILIVEDNLEMQGLLMNVLKSEFYLDFAENGQIGEDMAIQLQPDLVISDVMMPEKDGFELLKALKENFNSSHIPVVLLTARGDSASRVIGLNQDADDYIEKPFKSIELIARINNLLRQRIHLHRLFSENPLLFSKEIKCTPIDGDFIDRARKILNIYYSDGDFSVNVFCRELALNKTSVNFKLKALTNQTIAEYIKNFRLEKAAKLLIETNLSITEICMDTGFNNTQVFNKAFKKKFELPPSIFRANYHEK